MSHRSCRKDRADNQGAAGRFHAEYELYNVRLEKHRKGVWVCPRGSTDQECQRRFCRHYISNLSPFLSADRWDQAGVSVDVLSRHCESREKVEESWRRWRYALRDEEGKWDWGDAAWSRVKVDEFKYQRSTAQSNRQCTSEEEGAVEWVDMSAKSDLGQKDSKKSERKGMVAQRKSVLNLWIPCVKRCVQYEGVLYRLTQTQYQLLSCIRLLLRNNFV